MIRLLCALVAPPFPPLVVLAQATDLISWEKLSGVSGGVVLGMAVVAFIKGWIVPGAYLEQWKQLYHDADEDRKKTAQRLEETIEMFRRLLEVNEGLKEQVEQSKHQLNQLTNVVKEKGA